MERQFLLVDDDHDDAELFRYALEKTGSNYGLVHLDEANSLCKYLADEQNLKPNIIFLDLNINEINGFDCLKDIRNNEDTKDIPIIMFTTSKNKSDILRARSLGATGFITKPTDFNQLINYIQEIAAGEIIWTEE